jgi:hypothetical protein
MNNQEYLQTVKSRFGNKVTFRQDTNNMLITYEEIFKFSWIATKLKITSFVKYLPSPQLNEIVSYSDNCLKQAIRENKGLPIGFQNGVVSYSVIASDEILSDAITFVTSRPNKHFAAFEIPVLFDLTRNEIHYYKGEIIWGKIYERFLKEYLIKHFYVVK